MGLMIFFLLLIAFPFFGQDAIVMRRFSAEPPPKAAEESAEDDSEFISSEEINPSWKFRKFAALGYRRERQRWNEYTAIDQDAILTHYKKRQTLAFTGGSHMEWLGLVLNFEGSYGWLLRGRADVYDRLNGFEFENLNLGAGYTADARALISVRLKLIERENILFSFLPGGGLEYAHLQNTVDGNDRALSPDGATFSVIEFPKPNQQDWFGPIARGSLELFLFQKGLVTFFYQYEKPRVRSKSKLVTETYGFTGETLSLFSRTKESALFRGKSVRTHLGGIDFRYHDAKGWMFGAHFEGKRSWSKTSQIKFTRTIESFLPSPRLTTFTDLTVRSAVFWTEYWVYLFAGYKF